MPTEASTWDNLRATDSALEQEHVASLSWSMAKSAIPQLFSTGWNTAENGKTTNQPPVSWFVFAETEDDMCNTTDYGNTAHPTKTSRKDSHKELTEKQAPLPRQVSENPLAYVCVYVTNTFFARLFTFHYSVRKLKWIFAVRLTVASSKHQLRNNASSHQASRIQKSWNYGIHNDR